MSVVPLRLRGWWPESDRPVSRSLDQHFGKGLSQDDLKSREPSHSIFRTRIYRCPVRDETEEKFQVMLDVQQFLPKEITVKTAGNNNIIVEAKHEERQDEHGFVSRHFVRRYVLPPPYDVTTITSSLCSDGVLTIMASQKREVRRRGERIIEIVKTGEPASKPVKIETTTEETGEK